MAKYDDFWITHLLRKTQKIREFAETVSANDILHFDRDLNLTIIDDDLTSLSNKSWVILEKTPNMYSCNYRYFTDIPSRHGCIIVITNPLSEPFLFRVNLYIIEENHGSTICQFHPVIADSKKENFSFHIDKDNINFRLPFSLSTETLKLMMECTKVFVDNVPKTIARPSTLKNNNLW